MFVMKRDNLCFIVCSLEALLRWLHRTTPGGAVPIVVNLCEWQPGLWSVPVS